MANTCCTDAIITTKTTEQANRLLELLAKATKADHENPGWIGGLWIFMGKPPKDVSDGKFGECAGVIECLTRTENEKITVTMLTKWNPMLRALRDFLNEYAPSADLQYIAHEPLNDIYETSYPDETVMAIELDDANTTGENMAFLKDWSGIVNIDQIGEDLGSLLNMDVTGFTQDVVDAFETAYPVTCHVFDHVDLDDACP